MKNDITQHISNARIGRTYSPKQEEDLLPDNFMLGMTNETAETDYEPKANPTPSQNLTHIPNIKICPNS